MAPQPIPSIGLMPITRSIREMIFSELSGAIESPTDFAHRKIVPSVTVSPNWGIFTIVDMTQPIVRATVSTIRSTEGIARSSSDSAAGSGM